MANSDITSFHKVEYECLRKETDLHMKEYGELERNALIASALIWTWLGVVGKNITFGFTGSSGYPF
jgi:hypothetical protein